MTWQLAEEAVGQSASTLTPRRTHSDDLPHLVSDTPYGAAIR